MGYTKEALAHKLVEMYPEIEKHNLKLDLEFSDAENAWVIDLTRGEHKLRTFLERKDADDCMNGIKCVYLGVQIGQFVQHFDEDEAKSKSNQG